MNPVCWSISNNWATKAISTRELDWYTSFIVGTVEKWKVWAWFYKDRVLVDIAIEKKKLLRAALTFSQGCSTRDRPFGLISRIPHCKAYIINAESLSEVSRFSLSRGGFCKASLTLTRCAQVGSGIRVQAIFLIANVTAWEIHKIRACSSKIVSVLINLLSSYDKQHDRDLTSYGTPKRDSFSGSVPAKRSSR